MPVSHLSCSLVPVAAGVVRWEVLNTGALRSGVGLLMKECAVGCPQSSLSDTAVPLLVRAAPKGTGGQSVEGVGHVLPTEQPERHSSSPPSSGCP